MKEFFTKKRAALMACVFAVVTALTTVCAFAEGGGGSANAAVVTGFTSVAADMVATGQSLIPIALTVVAVSLVARYGVKLFKSIGK